MTDKSTISLESPTKSDKTVHIYFNPKPTIRVCLRFFKQDVHEMSLADLITKSIKSLSQDYLLEMNPSRFSYCLFPANKTGSKKSGYPGFDSKTLVSSLNVRRFYLEEVNKAFSVISTEFNLERKYGMEKKVKDQVFCCQVFSLLKV